MAEFQKLSDCISYYQNYHLTKHKYENRAKHLMFFDKYNLVDLKRHHVKRYHAERSKVVKNSTINREIAFARAAINCVNWDYEIRLNNPFHDMKFVESDHIPHYLTFEQFKLLLNQCKLQGYDDLHDFVLLLALTGARPNELYTLEWCNVNFEKRLYVVRNCWSKSKRTLYKYLNDTAFDVLKARYVIKNGDYVFMNEKTGTHIQSYHKILKK